MPASADAPRGETRPIADLVAAAKSNWCALTHGHGMLAAQIAAIDELARRASPAGGGDAPADTARLKFLAESEYGFLGRKMGDILVTGLDDLRRVVDAGIRAARSTPPAPEQTER